MSTSQNTRPKPSLQVPLASLALWCVLVAIASLATLVIVVSVKGIDALSTVALALAILAFVVQLIVFIVQAAQATEQNRQSSELHAEMMSVLAQLQERTQGTQRSVDRMNVRLLEAVIGKASTEGLSVDSPDFAARIVEAVSSEEEARKPSTRGSSAPRRNETHGSNYPDPFSETEAAAIHQEMRRPLNASDAKSVQEIVKGFDKYELGRLADFARDMEQFSRPNAVFGPGSRYESGPLLKEGLIQKIPGWKLFTLTSKGRTAGRLFTAGLEPGVTAPDLAAIKKYEEDDRKEFEERMRNREG